MSPKPTTFRPTDEAQEALKFIIDYLRSNTLPGIAISDNSAINYALIDTANRIRAEHDKPRDERK